MLCVVLMVGVVDVEVFEGGVDVGILFVDVV